MQIEQTELLMAVFGAFDENIKQIERELNVSVISRGTELKITGEDEGVSIAARAITALLAMAAEENPSAHRPCSTSSGWRRTAARARSTR